jgi:hypothetical protein
MPLMLRTKDTDERDEIGKEHDYLFDKYRQVLSPRALERLLSDAIANVLKDEGDIVLNLRDEVNRLIELRTGIRPLRTSSTL